ncbi:hypothetical protein COLO4_37580 [Corchorus olitorius]|uniref:Uncharacterized protein n=1 Tax=Corchorus olitorius TaxID=93759 RepID=A0A1R3G0N6_9ROSI|nr:hypothetical protein COLO4_37580 [Corchorus olitorius]
MEDEEGKKLSDQEVLDNIVSLSSRNSLSLSPSTSFIFKSTMVAPPFAHRRRILMPET